VARRVEELRTEGHLDAPVVRQSPGRYIVQLGPVALTLTWLRSTLGHVSDGQLLVVVWRGSVAPSRKHEPERPSPSPSNFATMVWEDTLNVEADSEASWLWRGSTADCGAWTSEALADRCAVQLLSAHDDALAAAVTPETRITT
jgi:hypothetical protein